MTEPEIRRALAMCDDYAQARDQTLEQSKFYAALQVLTHQVHDPVTGYAATLRALLEARELLRDCQEELPFGTQALADLNERVRAFLAEGESK